VVKGIERQLQVGDTVLVPWGLGEPVPATVVEVWGDPPAHVRVRLRPPEADESDEPTVILVRPDAVTPA